MNCRKVGSLLSAYIDGELLGVEHRQINEHLRDCAPCEEEHQSLLMTKRLLSGLSLPTPNFNLEDRLLNRIAEERGRGSGMDSSRSNFPFDWHGLWATLGRDRRDQVRVLAFGGGFALVLITMLGTPLLMNTQTAQKESLIQPTGVVSNRSVPAVPVMSPVMLPANSGYLSNIPMQNARWLHNPTDNAPTTRLTPASLEGR